MSSSTTLPPPDRARRARPSTERLIDSLVAQLASAPAGALPVRALRWLPTKVRALAESRGEIEAWRAWTDGSQVLLALGSESRALATRFASDALHVFLYDEAARLTHSGAYVRTRAGEWTRVEELPKIHPSASTRRALTLMR